MNARGVVYADYMAAAEYRSVVYACYDSCSEVCGAGGGNSTGDKCGEVSRLWCAVDSRE